MSNISSLTGTFPTGEDLTGAAAALMRLQDTYKLDSKSMAKGEFGGIKVAAEMNTQVKPLQVCVNNNHVFELTSWH